MEFSWAPSKHIKAISAWAVVLTAVVAAVANAETVRDWIATSPDKHNDDVMQIEREHDGDILLIETAITAHTAEYQQTAEMVVANCQNLKQSTINGLNDQITNISIKKAGAAQEVRAVLLQLENKINQQITKAEAEKAKC